MIASGEGVVKLLPFPDQLAGETAQSGKIFLLTKGVHPLKVSLRSEWLVWLGKHQRCKNLPFVVGIAVPEFPEFKISPRCPGGNSLKSRTARCIIC